MTERPITAEYFAKRAINFALTQPQAQRIHRALLCLEMVEDRKPGDMCDECDEYSGGLSVERLLRRLDAASKEMETRP